MVTITTWNKLAETCNQYLNQSQKVYCEGRCIREAGTVRMVKTISGQGNCQPGDFPGQESNGQPLLMKNRKKVNPRNDAVRYTV
jgi:hypothetical protein